MSRFPKHFGSDVGVRDVDLDQEDVHFRGERLGEARAEVVAEEVLSRVVSPARVLLVAASYVVLRNGDHVLLQLRRGTGYLDGHWATLAGHLERDESAHDAAIREAREEAGIEIGHADLRPLTTLHRYEVGGPQVEQRCDFFFETTTWAGEPTVQEPAKCAAMQWFPLDGLPEPVVPHELVVLRALRDGETIPAVMSVRLPNSAR